ncbi:MAG: hypothetical protein [Caudoviricetes sp.]|nr:MAG: hypothetical protein [Caudoviricetes sp.]
MKAQNEFGKNEKEFVKFMNNNLKTLGMTELFYEAWKLGFEPSAVQSYLHSEVCYSALSFAMRLQCSKGSMSDAELKNFSSFEALNNTRKGPTNV